MTAFEAKRIADIAKGKSSEDKACAILNMIEEEAKRGMYSLELSYNLPIDFDYTKLAHRLKHEGYRCAIEVIPQRFCLKVMWD